jgi:hypothetical protein
VLLFVHGERGLAQAEVPEELLADPLF